jgi:hypothetical protein
MSSAPGCSGCPLFDKDAKLAGLVHGETKHRGKQSHADEELKSVSLFVYADMIACKDVTLGLGHQNQGVELLPVPEDDEFYKLLQDAENIPPKVAENPEMLIKDFDETVKNEMVQVHGDSCLDATLNSMMSDLAGKIWPDVSAGDGTHMESIHLHGTITVLTYAGN